MTRNVLVFLLAALTCLSLAWLRVTLFELLSTPHAPTIAPRPVDDPDAPEPHSPVEYIARHPDAARPGMERSALMWSAPMPSREPQR